MAFQVELEGVEKTQGLIGQVGTGMINVIAESAAFPNDDRWVVECADIKKTEADRIWTPVHNTGTSTFLGITAANRALTLFTSIGYLYRVRRTAGSGNNTEVAFTWDEVNTKIWR